eukprot:718461-Prymnesium_polylepis.1
MPKAAKVTHPPRRPLNCESDRLILLSHVSITQKPTKAYPPVARVRSCKLVSKPTAARQLVGVPFGFFRPVPAVTVHHRTSRHARGSRRQ